MFCGKKKLLGGKKVLCGSNNSLLVGNNVFGGSKISLLRTKYKFLEGWVKQVLGVKQKVFTVGKKKFLE